MHPIDPRARLLHALCLAFLAGGLAGCGGSGDQLSDPDGLVRFTVPAGWEVRSEANGLRLGRADAPEERTVLFVKARRADPERTLASKRETRLSQIASQGAESAIDARRDMNGFAVWESLATPSGARRPAMHTFHLFSDALEVEVGLIATQDRRADYADDLEAVARSVRPN